MYTYIFFLDGSVSIAETGKNNDYPEGNILKLFNIIIITKNDYVNLYMNIVESIVPIKRTRRSMAPSPSPAEGQASKPESTAIMSEVSRMNEKNYIYLLFI